MKVSLAAVACLRIFNDKDRSVFGRTITSVLVYARKLVAETDEGLRFEPISLRHSNNDGPIAARAIPSNLNLIKFAS